MMAINGYRVINVFKTTNIYLLHPAKKIFRKFPKMDFLKNILILPLDIYLKETDTTDKKTCFMPTLTKIISHLNTI